MGLLKKITCGLVSTKKSSISLLWKKMEIMEKLHDSIDFNNSTCHYKG